MRVTWEKADEDALSVLQKNASTGGGTAFLSFGDAGEVPATAMYQYYEISAFQSSILQITHHGLTTGANESQEWRNLKKLYEGAGVDYAFLPMGAAYGSRNGRWSVLCGWGYTGGQASFALNREDDAAGVSMAAYDAFIASVKGGTNNGKTFLGYKMVSILLTTDRVESPTSHPTRMCLW